MGVVHRGRAAAAATLAATIVSGAWACSSVADHPGELGNTEHDASTGDTGSVVQHEAGPPQDASKPSTCTSVDGGCNALQNCDPKVDVVKVGIAAPAAVGGAVPPGTYAMTSYRLLTGNGGAAGPTSAWFRETMAIGVSAADGGALEAGAEAGDAGGEGATDADVDGASESGASDGGAEAEAGTPAQVYDWQDISQSDTAAEHTLSGVISFDPPSSMTVTFTCPSAPPFFANYTSNAGALVVYVDNGALGVGEITYTKQ
ncbi:MAG TPA: hypothetical protein VIF15_14870 [Polyangiaceae bacterium]|jgi:hypothetical protein